MSLVLGRRRWRQVRRLENSLGSGALAPLSRLGNNGLPFVHYVHALYNVCMPQDIGRVWTRGKVYIEPIPGGRQHEWRQRPFRLSTLQGGPSTGKTSLLRRACLLAGSFPCRCALSTRTPATTENTLPPFGPRVNGCRQRCGWERAATWKVKLD